MTVKPQDSYVDHQMNVVNVKMIMTVLINSEVDIVVEKVGIALNVLMIMNVLLDSSVLKLNALAADLTQIVHSINQDAI